jgi:hypothetical protein
MTQVENCPNNFTVVLYGALITFIFLVSVAAYYFITLSKDDCTTTTTRYADGRVVSERICE